MYKKFGFTLAEVLVTLGIIGVVAALTIPSTIAKYQQEATVAKIQKAVTILNQAYRLSIAEVGEPDDVISLGSEKYFDTYWRPYIKSIKECPRTTSGYTQCNYKSRQPFLFANKKASDREFTRGGDDRTTFFTPDGMLFIIHTGLNGSTTVYNGIMVDVNGPQGPNRYGHDVFLLQRNIQRGIIEPEGYDQTDDEVNRNCSTTGNGNYCAERIRRHGWKIDKNNYPW